MTEDEKKQVAVFRFGIINEFVGGRRSGSWRARKLLAEKCAHRWFIPFSGKSRISRSTILRWIRIYLGSSNKLESLYPKDRNDNGQVRALDEDTCLALTDLRRQMPKLTVVELIKLMRQKDLVTVGTALNLSTVYRFLHSNNLMAKEQGIPTDRRKFEAELPNDMWQSDVMHGPACYLWLSEYHSREHSSTKQSPFKRFTSKMECLRAAPDNLQDYFRKTVRRRVNKDRTVVVDCRLYEAPVELIGKRVELLYFEESPEQVEIRCGSTSYGTLRQVDLHVNSRVKRDKNGQIELVDKRSTTSVQVLIPDGTAGISGQLWESA